MSKIETLALALALLLATSVVAMARNDQVGQSSWCWVSEHSNVATQRLAQYLDVDVNQHGQDACPSRGSEPLALG